jgi:hypothetical protein
MIFAYGAHGRWSSATLPINAAGELCACQSCYEFRENLTPAYVPMAMPPVANLDKRLLREISTPPLGHPSLLVEHRGRLDENNPDAVLAYFNHRLAYKAIKGMTKFTRCQIDSSPESAPRLYIQGSRPTSDGRGAPIRSNVHIYCLSTNDVLAMMRTDKDKAAETSKVIVKMTPAMRRFEMEENYKLEDHGV